MSITLLINKIITITIITKTILIINITIKRGKLTQKKRIVLLIPGFFHIAQAAWQRG